MKEFKPINQEEFMKVNSDLDKMLQKKLLEKLGNNEINVNDYWILSRAHSSFSSYLDAEVAM